MTTTTKPTQSPHRRVQEMVADRIIKLLDRGELPPWEKSEPDSENPAPINGARLQPYRGINRWLALMTREEMGYQDPRWLTPKQAEQLGGGIREGEVDTKFVFWSRVTRESRGESRAGGDHFLPAFLSGLQPGTDPKLRSRAAA